MKGKSMWDLVPKAAGPVSFASPTASPIRSYSRKGRRVSLFPRELRRKVRTMSFDRREPSSPKVSCIGQVGNRKKNKNNNKEESESVVCNGVIKRLVRFFHAKKEKTRDQSDHHNNPNPNAVGVEIETIKTLGQIKQFASGRGGALSNFKCQEDHHL
ncbi:hypothetical protein M5689_014134 [Euphorbia peplus]|nr:hypothetical protein M5689_014134 [Euphorbia peplus]